ncbi:MAG: glycosyltransferase family 2 protein [Chitinophagales bacterium]|nr:glycosyltransferase family 2 protein [Chitinophagales bacterium]MDW8393293.1 glycosyltransferase family 2 protein [Chitinophagales bacterium]
MSVVVDVIIPALNEQQSVGLVVKAIDRSEVRHIVVVDNGSKDQTAQVAAEAGATVLEEPEKGYGAACLRGLAYLSGLSRVPDLVVFLDADFADDPAMLGQLIAPIRNGEADLVIGTRVAALRQPGSMTIAQRWGNQLATTLIRWLYGYRFSDLGPFRAIRWTSLMQLGMSDRNYGWTVEMQVKAARQGLRCCEVAVPYRVRIGQSKVSGTVRGTVLAGYKILFTVFKYALR